MDRLIRMLKLLLLGLLAVMIMGFIKRARVQVNFDDLADAVCAGIDTDTLKQADSRALKRLYGINSEDLAGFVLYTSIESMDVDELLLLEVKSPQLADAAEQSISKRIDSQLANFEGYGAEQTKLIRDHILTVRGNYLLFVISPEAETYSRAFIKGLKTP